MGSSLRDRCGSAARALLLSGLLAVAWLVWGAGTADAAQSDPVSGPGPVILLERVPEHSPLAKASAAPTVVTHALKPAAPTKVVAAVADTAAPVVNRAATAVATVANSAAPVLTEAAPVLTEAAPVLTEAAPVLNGAAPVLTEVVEVIDQVAGTVPVSLPVSAVLPDPVRLPVTAGQQVRPDDAAVAALPQHAKAGSAQRTAGPGLTLAQLRFDASAVPRPAAADYLALPSPTDAPLGAERLLWLSALQGHSGSASSGAGSEGAQTAGDTAGFWNPLDARRSARTPDMPQVPVASPSFDPGSSPD